ncbi:MAG TPA: hotdog fold thioesterase [Candidatus Nanopelagicaceae bacterium]|nr:hotdog fold thioesterase [Candidatus Nanopelagicaceae bacterium]
MTTNDQTDENALFLEALAGLGPNSLGDKVGIKLVSATRAKVVATMPVAGNTQPHGLLHGGASLVLAETLGSYGAALHAGQNKIVVGLDINATHHRSAHSGLVTGIGTPISVGKTVVTYEVVITDEAEQRICTARITCLIRDQKN